MGIFVNPLGYATNGESKTVIFTEQQLTLLRNYCKYSAECLSGSNQEISACEELLELLDSTQICLNERQFYNLEQLILNCRDEMSSCLSRKEKKVFSELLDTLKGRTSYGKLQLRIEEILDEKGISKNQICRDLDIPRSNFNRYCRNDFQRMDADLICKLCWYLNIGVQELIVYLPPKE